MNNNSVLYRFSLLISLITLISCPLVAQQNVADSLKKILSSAKNDTTKIHTLILISEEYSLSLPDTALYYTEKALYLCDTLLFSESNELIRIALMKQKALTLNNFGTYYQDRGETEKALRYHNKSLQIRKKINDKNGIANSLNNIGYNYKNIGETEKALEYFNKSLKIREEINDIKGIATSLNNIGYIYYYQGNVEKTIEYLHKSIKFFEEIHDK
ncbi:MAG: tetratricopeptide repeat protein, partial [Bacteroidota bacterium]